MKIKTKTFFEELQLNTKIEKRDKRGQTHKLSLILVELVFALLSNRDGNNLVFIAIWLNITIN